MGGPPHQPRQPHCQQLHYRGHRYRGWLQLCGAQSVQCGWCSTHRARALARHSTAKHSTQHPSPSAATKSICTSTAKASACRYTLSLLVSSGRFWFRKPSTCTGGTGSGAQVVQGQRRSNTQQSKWLYSCARDTGWWCKCESCHTAWVRTDMLILATQSARLVETAPPRVSQLLAAVISALCRRNSRSTNACDPITCSSSAAPHPGYGLALDGVPDGLRQPRQHCQVRLLAQSQGVAAAGGAGDGQHGW